MATRILSTTSFVEILEAKSGKSSTRLMASNTFGQKTFTPTPPAKGSFPLDHEGECKKFMLRYMLCLREKGNVNTDCRPLAKEYLDCRMDKQLMAREEWSKLGFGDLVTPTNQS